MDAWFLNSTGTRHPSFFCGSISLLEGVDAAFCAAAGVVGSIPLQKGELKLI